MMGARGRQRLPGHTDEDMLRLEARRPVHAGILPSNQTGMDLDPTTLSAAAPETYLRGYTAQQPWGHVDIDVLHYCVMCGRPVDPDFLADHPKKCRVSLVVKALSLTL